MSIVAKRDGFIHLLPAGGSNRVSRGEIKPYRSLASAFLIFALLLCLNAVAFSASPASVPLPDQKTISAVLPATIDNSLDSKKRNAGDEFEAKTTVQLELPDGTFIPREAKIMGHITGSKARSKGDAESTLTLVFEKVMLPQGKVLDIKGTLQAVAPNPNGDESSGGVDYGTSMSRTLQHAGPGQTSNTTIPILNSQSVGAQGMKDLALNGDGVLISPGKQVKLDHGVQLLLKIQIVSH